MTVIHSDWSAHLWDLQAGQLAHLCTGEAVHRVCADFESKLSSVQHLPLERVSFFLQLSFRPEHREWEELGWMCFWSSSVFYINGSLGWLKPLSGRQQVLQDLREESFPHRTLHKHVTCGSLDEVLRGETGDTKTSWITRLTPDYNYQHSRFSQDSPEFETHLLSTSCNVNSPRSLP